MDTNILTQLEESIEISSNLFKDDTILKEFELASIQFEELVKKGLVKKRGYSLVSITDIHLFNTYVNYQINSSVNNNILA
jgi:hypothetical protein